MPSNRQTRPKTLVPVDLAEIRQRAELLRLAGDSLLTTTEVAAATGVSASTLRQYAGRRGPNDLVPSVKRAGKNLYRVQDVRRWFALEEPDAGARTHEGGTG